MGKLKENAMAYKNVSTSSVISTGPAMFYGLSLIPATTGVVTALVYDAVATAAGTCIFAYRVASTAGMATLVLNHPIACRTGIYLSTPSVTSGADQVVVLYGT